MIIIDEASPVPPFEQIREQLGDLIRAGTMEPGHRLPSIRQLAGDLRVAAGTVARAYSGLESAGLIELNRATGAKVCTGQGAPAEVQRAASDFAATAKVHALTLDEALGAVRAQWRRP